MQFTRKLFMAATFVLVLFSAGSVGAANDHSSILAFSPGSKEHARDEFVLIDLSEDDPAALSLEYRSHGGSVWRQKFNGGGYDFHGGDALLVSTFPVSNLEEQFYVQVDSLGFAASGSLRLITDAGVVLDELSWEGLEGDWIVSSAIHNNGVRSTFEKVMLEDLLEPQSLSLVKRSAQSQSDDLQPSVEQDVASYLEIESLTDEAERLEVEGGYSYTPEAPQLTSELEPDRIQRGDLIVTELYPNPEDPFTDAKDEFIELYNTTDKEISMKGLRLYSGKNLSYSHTILPVVIGPGEYLALYSADTGLTLSNKEGGVALFDSGGGLIDRTDVYTSAPGSESYSRLGDGTWLFTTALSPGKKNTIPDGSAVTVRTDLERLQDEGLEDGVDGGSVSSEDDEQEYSYSSEGSAKLAGSVLEADAGDDPFGEHEEQPQSVSIVTVFVVSVALISVFVYAAYEYRHEILSVIKVTRRHLQRWA